MFFEVEVESFPKFVKEENKSYFLTGTDPIIHRLFRYNNYYVAVELVNDIYWLSIIKQGSVSQNILSQCKELVDYLLKEKEVAFFWENGIRNEILIKRLLANYKFTNYNPNNMCSCAVINNEPLL